MFPGVTSGPFTNVRLGPDVVSGSMDAYPGYLPKGNISAFSLMHQSGTGGAPKYGVVSQLPVVGRMLRSAADLSNPRSGPDRAEVGRYHSSLSNGVSVDLAATDHAGLFSYQFPKSTNAMIVVDVSHFLPSHRGLGTEQRYVSGNISIVKGANGQLSYEGDATYSNGWNLGKMTIYFCGHFDSRATATFFKGAPGKSVPKPVHNVHSDVKVGVTFSFMDHQVTSRVGVSWISSTKACELVDSEIPPSTTVVNLASAAKDRWNSKVLSTIKANTKNPDTLRLLYSSLYGVHLMPTNRTAENPSWDSNEPYYDDHVTLWDLFRCSTPLMQILQPEAYEEQIRSLIDIWRHDGYMPDGRSSNSNGRTQGGSNADNILADAYVKNVRGKVKWEDGFKAMVKDAEVPPPNDSPDPSSPESSSKEGRGAGLQWLTAGYVSTEFTRSVTRAIEYSVNDFALYQVASGLGHEDDAVKYLDRSRNWRNHWNPNATALGFKGFIVPISKDGKFIDQDPLSCGGCYWGSAYYEGLPWEYSFNPHHDINTLIDYMGGDERFISRLNTTFERNKNPNGNPKFGNTIFNPSNEVSFTTPYLYHCAGRQDLSIMQSRHIARTYYNSGRSGLPGNSDSGAMQTWLLWNMIGLYPMTGQTTFLIGSPWFDMNIDLGGRKTLKISRKGEGDYVQSLRVNGVVWEKNWLRWGDVFDTGGVMEFSTREEPGEWSWDGERPPSPASEGKDT
ncbi:MAG: hypothetical protein Q9182_004942 [Xanthomendoza sp. 2 TL-2023]